MLEEWGVPLAVVGMLVATLFMAAVLQRYQAHQTVVRARIRRLEHGIQVTVGALDALRGVSLSRELRLTLRGDVLARYQHIARLFRRYPEIARRVREAEAALNSEGAPGASGVGPLDDEQAFRRLLRAIDDLTHVIETGDTLRPIPRDVRQIFRRELGERRAEANAQFHLVQAGNCRRSGDTSRARTHLTTLMRVLNKRGPATAFVRELYSEAEHALDDMLGRSSKGGTDDPPASGDAESARLAG